MANVKISGLAAAAVTAAANEFEINEAGTSKKVTGLQILTYVFSPNDIEMSGTGSLKVPTGTTGERSASAANGMFRYNTLLLNLKDMLQVPGDLLVEEHQLMEQSTKTQIQSQQIIQYQREQMA